jgi:peptidyl-tRNA hydrolase
MKQVIIVNSAIRLPKGKLAAQVAHAAVGAFLAAGEDARQAWLDEGMPKVVLSIPSVEDLLALQTQADEQAIPNCLIEDAGRTVVPEGTITCLGLGPADDAKIDLVTGHLKLL